jgi:hypothetical protein
MCPVAHGRASRDAREALVVIRVDTAATPRAPDAIDTGGTHCSQFDR